MGLVLITPPAIEPITLAQAKQHLRVETADDDALIAGLIRAAREAAERATGRAIVTQTWDQSFDGFPARACAIVPAKPPLIGVTSITYIDGAGAAQTLSSALYKVDTISDPGRIVPAYGETWPATRAEINAVTLRFVAGYGAGTDSPPGELIGAMLTLIEEMYRVRGDTTAMQQNAAARASAGVFLGYRDWRF